MTTDAHWLTRDHVLVVQAARAWPTEPAYAMQLLAMVGRPTIDVALELIRLLMTERVERWAEE